MSSDLKRQLKKGGTWLLVSNLVMIGSQLLSVALLARLLHPADFGLQAIAVLVLEILAVFTYPVINKAIILRKETPPGFLASATIFSIVLSLAGAAILFFSSPLFALIFPNAHIGFLIRCVAAIFLVRGCYQPYQSIFEKELRFKEIANLNLAAYLIGGFLVPVILALLGYGFKSLILGLLVSELVMLFYFPVRSKLYFTGFSAAFVREIITDGRSILLQNFSNKLATNGDYLVISNFLGPVALGLYSQAYKIMKMPTTIIGNVINNMSFAGLSKISGDTEKLHRAFVYSSFVLAFFALPVSVVALKYSREIILLLLGPQWLDAAASLRILAFGIFLRMSYKVPGTILKVRQRFGLVARLQTLYAICVIGFSILLAGFSIEGVAFGTLAALLLQYAQLTYYVHSDLKMPFAAFFRAIATPALVSILFYGLLSAAGFLIHSAGPVHAITASVLEVIIATAIMTALIIWKGKKLLGPSYSWWVEEIAGRKASGKRKALALSGSA